MRLLWATRGRTWGFQFVLDGGFPDPLVPYEEAFSGISDAPDVCRRTREKMALRFPDPHSRKDASGRVIPHDFVIVWPWPWADRILSVEDGIRLLWPLVADEFDKIWQLPKPPRREGDSGN